MTFSNFQKKIDPGSGPRGIRSSSPPAPSDSMGCGRMELLRPSGRTGRAIGALVMSSYRPSRSGEWNSDGIVVELWSTQLELFFPHSRELSGRDLQIWPCAGFENSSGYCRVCSVLQRVKANAKSSSETQMRSIGKR